MKIAQIIYLLPSILLFSCGGGETKEPEKNDTTVAKVEVKIEYSEDVKTLIDKFKISSLDSIPLIVDSLFIANASSDDSLNGKEVMTLAKTWFKHDLNNGYEYELKSFHEIDSLKAKGKYADYLENLDIGMMKDVNCIPLSRYKCGDSTEFFVWAMKYGTYEACPYAAGTVIFTTHVYNGQIVGTFVLGEDMSAGDAPVGMSRLVFSELNSSCLLNLNVKEESDEGDGYTETEIENYEFNFSSGKFNVVKEKKEKPKRVKNPE